MPIVKHLFVHEKTLADGRAAGSSGHGRLGLKAAHTREPEARVKILMVDNETLEAMDLSPGVIRENITTSGLNVNGLEIGQKLRVGETHLEVSALCTPCDQLEKIGRTAKRDLGRRGMLCRVIEGG